MPVDLEQFTDRDGAHGGWTRGWTMNSDLGSLEGGRPMVGQAATCPFVGFWPCVGKAVVHAVANRTIDLYSIALFAAPRI